MSITTEGVPRREGASLGVEYILHTMRWAHIVGCPRIDTTEHIYFANDQLAVRFIEEIDFDYAAVDATAALLTAAS